MMCSPLRRYKTLRQEVRARGFNFCLISCGSLILSSSVCVCVCVCVRVCVDTCECVCVSGRAVVEGTRGLLGQNCSPPYQLLIHLAPPYSPQPAPYSPLMAPYHPSARLIWDWKHTLHLLPPVITCCFCSGTEESIIRLIIMPTNTVHATLGFEDTLDKSIRRMS